MFNPFEVSQRNFQLSVENNRFALVLSFALLCSVIGPEKSRHSINQLNSKLTPIMTWSPAFSRAPWAVCVILVWISIGSSRYLIFFRVAVVLTLVLVLRQSSIEERSIYNWVHRQTTLCVLGYNNCWYQTNKIYKGYENCLSKLHLGLSISITLVLINAFVVFFFFTFMGRFKLLSYEIIFWAGGRREDMTCNSMVASRDHFHSKLELTPSYRKCLLPWEKQFRKKMRKIPKMSRLTLHVIFIEIFKFCSSRVNY